MFQNFCWLKVLILSFLSTSSANMGDKCSLLANANAGELMQYLSTPRNNTTDFDCSVFAILKLGILKESSASEVLVQYLIYREPPTDEERLHVMIHPRTINGIYPASRALASIGKPSLPALLAAIQSPAATTTFRQNAVYTIMEIFDKEDVAGVKFIRDAALNMQDAEKRARLNQAAAESVRWCHFSNTEKCREVLYQR